MRLPTILQSVVQRGQGDDGGAVLIVVEHGDVEALDQRRLDLKGAGGAMSSRLMPPKVGASGPPSR
jgi:hypothetical protein